MTTDQIVLELRSLPGAPDTLRERVRALPKPEPRREWSLPRIEWRRAVLVAAPAAVALAVGAAVIHGLGARDDSGTATSASSGSVRERAAQAGGAGAATPTTPVFGAHTKAPIPRAADLRLQPALAPAPSPARLNRYEAWLRVQVERDRLGKATSAAMKIARGYGGYVASVDLNTPARRGRAFLVLRVPTIHVQDAVMRLGALGDVTAQRVRIADLQRQYNQQQRQLVRLRAFITTLEQRLKSPSLTAAQRLQLQYQLGEAKRSFTSQTRAHQNTRREGTLATISVGFFVPGAAAAAKPSPPGRAERTLRDAGHFLVLELVWLLFALIVAAPFAVLAALAYFGARAARRASDRRLLESA